MPVLLDTGVLVAYLSRDDPEHGRARTLMNRIWRGEHGQPLTSEFVLAEALTLLRRRVGRKDVAERFLQLVFGSAGQLDQVRFVPNGLSVVPEAVRLHLENYLRGLSFTDCVLVALAKRTGGSVATFDAGFRGLAHVLEA